MERAGSGSPGSVMLCIAGNVLFGAGLFFHAFLYNFYLEALGHSEVVMGYAAAALTGGGLAMLLPAGRLVDRTGPRTAMVAASLVAALGLGLGAWMAAPLPICAAAALAGAGGGLWRVAVAPALMRLTDLATRARAFAWNVGLILLSGAGGVAIAGAAPGRLQSLLGISRLGAVRLVLLTGALATVSSMAAFGFLRSLAAAPAPRTGEEARSEGAAGSLPLVGVVAVFMLGAALLAPFLNIYFTRRFALSVGSVGLVFGGAQVVWSLAALGSGEMARRWGAGTVLPVAALLFPPAAWGLGMASGASGAALCYLLQGAIGPATNPLIDQVLLAEVPPGRQGVVSGWRNVAADVSGIVGASVGGTLLAAHGFGVLFAVASLLGLIGGVALLGWLRRR